MTIARTIGHLARPRPGPVPGEGDRSPRRSGPAQAPSDRTRRPCVLALEACCPEVDADRFAELGALPPDTH